MRDISRRLLLPLLAGAAFLSLAHRAAAQANALGGCDPDGPTPPFLSVESEIYYGCGWLFRSKPAQYFQAIGRFRSAVSSHPDNAIAHYLLGVALAGYDQPDSARVMLARAIELDPEVERKLAPRLAESAPLRARVDAVLGRGAAPPAPAAPKAPATEAATPRAREVAEARAPGNAPVRSTGGPLTLGTYACTYDSWSGAGANRRRTSEPKGSFTLRAGGTYSYLDNGGTGRYRYDPATGVIAWLSGPLAEMRPERTTFIRNTNTTQIDIRMTGVYEWSCGRNNR